MIAAGDVNGDGIDDVILDDGQVMSVVARTATGDGATLLAIDRGTWTGAHSKALGDVDGDGFDDVGVWHHDGTGLGYHLEVYAGGTSAPLRLVTSLDPATGL